MVTACASCSWFDDIGPGWFDAVIIADVLYCAVDAHESHMLSSSALLDRLVIHLVLLGNVCNIAPYFSAAQISTTSSLYSCDFLDWYQVCPLCEVFVLVLIIVSALAFGVLSVF